MLKIFWQLLLDCSWSRTFLSRNVGPIISTFLRRLAFLTFLVNLCHGFFKFIGCNGNVLLPTEMYLKMDMFMCCSTKWLWALRQRYQIHWSEKQLIRLKTVHYSTVWNLREFIFQIIADKALNGCTRKRTDIRYVINGLVIPMSALKFIKIVPYSNGSIMLGLACIYWWIGNMKIVTKFCISCLYFLYTYQYQTLQTLCEINLKYKFIPVAENKEQE